MAARAAEESGQPKEWSYANFQRPAAKKGRKAPRGGGLKPYATARRVVEASTPGWCLPGGGHGGGGHGGGDVESFASEAARSWIPKSPGGGGGGGLSAGAAAAAAAAGEGARTWRAHAKPRAHAGLEAHPAQYAAMPPSPRSRRRCC